MNQDDLNQDIANNEPDDDLDDLDLDTAFDSKTGMPPIFDPAALELAKCEKRLNNGRSSLLLIFLLSLANSVLLFLKTSFSFKFSLTIPLFMQGIGELWKEETGSSIMLIIGTVISLLLIALFGALYIASKKSLWPVIVAVVLFGLDTLLLLGLVLVDGNNFANFLIDLAFHAWAMGSLILFLVAKSKMTTLSPPQQ